MIKDLELKLSGELSVTRNDLIKLVNSWGRKDEYSNTDKILMINKCEPKECYPLENLDVSKIRDFSFVFRESYYNGDLSKWNTSNVKYMDYMFSFSDFNNDSLKNWNLSNVTNIRGMFYHTPFNGNISNWNISNIIEMQSVFEYSNFNGDISKWNFNQNVKCNGLFDNNKNFDIKYGNNLVEFIFYTKDFLQWFENNKHQIRNLNTTKEDILDFFSFDNNLNNDNELKII